MDDQDDSSQEYVDMESTIEINRKNAVDILKTKKTMKHVKKFVIAWCDDLLNDLSNDKVFEPNHKYHNKINQIYDRIQKSTIKISTYGIVIDKIENQKSLINDKFTCRNIVNTNAFYCEKIKSGIFGGMWLVFKNSIKSFTQNGNAIYDGYWCFLSLDKQQQYSGCIVL